MMYYFLGTSLPELQIGERPEITFEEFAFLLKMNLSESDFRKTEIIRRYFDIDNIRAFWSELPMGEMGNYSAKSLEEALLTRFGLPDYIYRFVDKYESLPSRIEHFGELQSSFFREEIRESEGFLKRMLQEERKIRLILAALRAKKLKQNIAPILQYEDPEDPLVRQIIAQQDSEEYVPPPEFEDLATLFRTYAHDPLALHKATVEYRFKKVEQAYGLEVFTLDRILGYMFQLILVENWMHLNEEKGRKILAETLITNL